MQRATIEVTGAFHHRRPALEVGTDWTHAAGKMCMAAIAAH